MAGKPLLRRSIPQSILILSKRQCRSLSSSSRLSLPAANADASGMAGLVRKNVAKQSSMQSQVSKMKGGQIPNDVGLIPGLFIRPKSCDLPSFASKQRLKIEWALFKQKMNNFFRLLFSTKWNVPVDPITKKWQRRPLLLRERAYLAKHLHAELSKAIANNNKARIEQIACNGLKQQLKLRFDRLEIARRSGDHNKKKATGTHSWSVEYRGWVPDATTRWIYQALCPPRFKAVQIVVDCEAMLPLGDNAFVRQIVAKIKTEQTLADGRGGRKTVELDEFVVIQKFLMEGVDDEWRIWGTIQPPPVTQINKLLKDSSDDSFSSKFSEQFQKWTGSTGAL